MAKITFKFLFTIIVTLVIATGCDNSKSLQEQQRVQQLHDDSVKQAVILDIKKQEAKRAEAQQRKEEKQQREIDRRIMQTWIAQTEAQLQGLKYKLDNAMSFQLLRSSSQKAKDIAYASEQVNLMQVRLDNQKAELEKLDAGQDYAHPNGRMPKAGSGD